MSARDYLSAEEIAAHESAMQAIRDKRAAAEQGIRDEIERLHKKLEEMHEKEKEELETLIVEQEKRVVLRRIYHEAPNDIMELIVMIFSNLGENGIGKGGMNVLRLVCKRLIKLMIG